MVLLWRQALAAAVLLKRIGVVLLGELAMVHCQEEHREIWWWVVVVVVVGGGGLSTFYVMILVSENNVLTRVTAEVWEHGYITRYKPGRAVNTFVKTLTFKK